MLFANLNFSVCSLCGVHKTKVLGFKIHAFTPINPLACKDMENKIKYILISSIFLSLDGKIISGRQKDFPIGEGIRTVSPKRIALARHRSSESVLSLPSPWT